MEARLSGSRVRQGDGERASLAYLAGHRHGSPVCLDNRLDDGQPQPSAAPVATTGLMGAIEPVKDVGQMLWRDPRTGVSNANLRLVLNLFHTHGDVTALRRVVQTVVNQIVDGLPEADSVHC